MRTKGKKQRDYCKNEEKNIKSDNFTRRKEKSQKHHNYFAFRGDQLYLNLKTHYYFVSYNTLEKNINKIHRYL